MRTIPVEICLDCVTNEQVERDVSAAAEGGAARVELCSNVAAGGVTPAPGLVAAARRAAPPSLQILVMIRPRPGDFHVMENDLEAMLRSIEESAAAGADGVVFGATLREPIVDLMSTRRLVKTAAGLGLKTTFHRAFDTLADRAGALQLLIDLETDRILTAGTPWNSGKPAVEGIDQLVSLAQQAINKIEIVIGGSVDKASALRLTKAMDRHTRHFSLHAYSSAHENGQVSRQKVAELVGASKWFSLPEPPGLPRE